MGLSRLDNFLKNSRGEILYVDPSNIDSTDSILNQGNSLARPFKTIQRALVEAARFSYQRGLDNDRFGKTTIMLYPGEHLVDNRPGWIPDGANNFRLRSGATSNEFPPFDLISRFDLSIADNALYKLNSIHGGVIVPRGTSIIGLDLRKTKIRPTYVPDPENDNIERSAIFRVTGACYFWQFTFLDALPTGTCYKDYTENLFVPNFSHHKLTVFEYADGVNEVSISDDFQTYQTNRTDLDMYYEKIGIAYGTSSGRPISPDYPSSSLDIQAKVDEYRIVGSRGAEVGISSIRAGDGVTSSNIINVKLSESLPGIDVDTPIRINGVGAAGYDGQYVISEVLSTGTEVEIQYQVQNSPVNPLPTVSGATLSITVDTVTSASPYIFNISLRSVFGMCGLHADGNKADGFKSMVVAQFTGVGLQKDTNAFVKYNSITGTYEDRTAIGNNNINTDSLARYKPKYESYHIKCDNDAYLQIVSVFAIGYADHFLAESGGDQSINNSNSNFGARALTARGFRSFAFPKDDVGYITHIIPPKELDDIETSVEYVSIDVDKTVSVGDTSKLFLYGYTNQSVRPDSVIEGYRIGAKNNDQLNVIISSSGISTEYSARIIMPSTAYSSNEITSEKNYIVGRSSVGINSISQNVVTFTQNHSFITGESIRIIGENGNIPDGLDSNQVYYAITSGTNIITPNQIKIAKNINDAINDNEININDNGGIIHVISRVSDKRSGDVGHPVQFDENNQHWYVNVATASSENTIYTAFASFSSSATPRTFIRRTIESRSLSDTIYKARYVIPSDSPVTARPPLDGYVIQESSSVIGNNNNEVAYQYNTGSVSLTNSSEIRNPRIIANASWSGGVATIDTEIPHNLSTNDLIEISNVVSSTNSTGIGNSAYNGTYSVSGISSAKSFNVGIATNPGTFQNNTSIRNTSLPTFKRKNIKDTFVIYRSQEIQKYVPGEQDGVYNLILINSSNSPSVEPFTSLNYSQPINNLYPQTNRDNPISDPRSAKSFAVSDPIGKVVIDDSQNSITKENLERKLTSFGVGIGLTNIISNSVSGTAHTFYTSIDHGLNRVVSVGILSTGFAYGSGSAGTLYNARLVGLGGTEPGQNATARISFDNSGQLTNVRIIDGGSAYAIGHSFSIVGVATTTNHVSGIVSVTQIYNNIGDTLNLYGVENYSNEPFNTSYRITGISTFNEINVSSASTISVGSTIGLGSTVLHNSRAYLSGRTLRVSSIVYNNNSGIATFTTTETHGLSIDNKVRLGGADNSLYNGDFIITNITGLNSFVCNIGKSSSTPSTSGTIYAYKPGYTSNAGFVDSDDENLSGRQQYIYAGITTTLLASIPTRTVGICSITNVGNLDLQIGDYLQINDEIVRIKSTVSGNPVSIFRGVLGSRTGIHSSGTIIRRIKPIPVELRRNSLIRASGHTFEYLGFGPGNYSTAFPERQNRVVTPQEELLAQSNKQDGGVVVFTGMNADGDFYVGNRKVSSTTGQEEVFDAPVPSVTGEDPTTGALNIGFDVLSPLEVSITRSLRVDGGPDNNIISKFNGPVILNEKLTSTSPKGIEANSLFLQGDSEISRKYTVSDTKPTIAGNPGDVVYRANPSSNGSLGWVYTTNNVWEQFGAIATGGSIPTNALGITTSGGAFNISTAINISSSTLDLKQVFDSTSGISTVNIDFLGSTNIPSLFVSGISTFVSRLNSNGGFFVNSGGMVANSGISTFNTLIEVNSGANVSGGMTADSIVSTSIDSQNAEIDVFTAGISTFNGNVIVGNTSKTTNSFIRVLSDDNSNAGIEAYGNSQGTGYLYVGQSSLYGGGILYNGDGIPTFASGETADTIAFYRKDNGNNQVVFSYPYNNDIVTFNGSIITGSLSADNISIDNSIVGSTATFSGSLSAASISSSGSISGSAISASGAVSAASASISGAVSAASASISGAVSAASASISGAVSGSTISDSKGNIRSIPLNTQSSTYTLVSADAGKVVNTTANIIVPPSVFSSGDAITIYNNSSSTISISQGSGVTLRQVVVGSTGSRSLSGYGLCTILCVGSNSFVISGAGLS
jgi:hypothetical protein